MRTLYLSTLILFFYASLSGQSFKSGPFTNKAISLPLVADFNGDAKSDVVGISRFFSPVGDLRLHINISLPDSIIFETVDLGLKALGNPGFGDFDADGDMDLIVTASEDSTILILLNTGDGTFESHPQVSEVAYIFRTADLDGDQDIDIVSLNRDERSAFLMINDGNGEFQTMSLLFNEEDLYTIELGDLDGDDDIDIIAGFDDFLDGKIILLENQGSGIFEEIIITENGAGSLENIQITDIDQDGFKDIAYSSIASSTLRAMINNGDQTYSEVNLVQGLGTIRSFNVADYNTDGIMDIILGCNSADNTYHQGLSSVSLAYDSEVITAIRPMFYIVNGDFDSDSDLDAILSNGDFWWISNELEQGPVSTPEIDDAPYNIYPNPFINYLDLNLKSNDVEIYISDLYGQTLLRSLVKSLPINLEFLKAGVYFFSVVDSKSGKLIQTSKIIKIE